MLKNNFDYIRENGLLYEYIRGSQAYGTALTKDMGTSAVSDVDTGGVFISPKEEIFGLNEFYVDMVSDEKNDNCWYELGKYLKLISLSNPNIIESLWIPDNCILFTTPIFEAIKSNRKLFLSKKIYETFGGYAESQIKKARGLNKAIVNPVNEKLTPLDFIYTFYGQGSSNIVNWLSHRGLKQRYCGLVAINNMRECYGVYYDWMTHIEVEYGGRDEFINLVNRALNNNDLYNFPNFGDFMHFLNSLCDYYEISYYEISESIKDKECLGYRGIINVDETSNELRLANIPKNETTICHIVYNDFGYKKHCLDYKRYQDWVRDRNPNRYELNKRTNYDSKNMMHMFRLIRTCTEALIDEELHIDRRGIDADFLIDIRLGKYSYEELIGMLEVEKSKMDEAYRNSKLQDNVNINDVNSILVSARNEYYFY